MQVNTSHPSRLVLQEQRGSKRRNMTQKQGDWNHVSLILMDLILHMAR